MVSPRILSLCFALTLGLSLTACNLHDEQPPSGNNGEQDTASADTQTSDAIDSMASDTADEDTEQDTGTDAVSCTAPEERCGNTCANTQTDPDHCGDCNSACAPPANAEVQACVGGDCQFTCADGYYDLNDDIFTDGCESECGPNAQEVCGDGVDNDCDEDVDEDCACSPDETQICGTDTGECSTGTQTCTDQGTWGPCNGQTTGTGEVCNGLDDDCDGDVDEGLTSTYYLDADNDGYGVDNDTTQACSPTGDYTATQGGDCNDGDGAINPDAQTDDCDGVDNDCDGTKDEDGTDIKYHDGDDDGYGDPNDTMTGCLFPSDYINDNTDCDDTDDTVNPGANELCYDSSVDRNCDGRPACTDPYCDDKYCQTSGGTAGYCINDSCVESGTCTKDFECGSGLTCESGCCCPNNRPCPCAL